MNAINRMHLFFWLGLTLWVIAAFAWSVEEAMGYVPLNNKKALRFYSSITFFGYVQLVFEIVITIVRLWAGTLFSVLLF
ncbi:MAG: hypothetical protein ABEK50_15115 [bacterium]